MAKSAKRCPTTQLRLLIFQVHNSLDHVEYGLVLPQPDVVVGYGHGLEGDALCVLEEGVGAPDLGQPLDREKSVEKVCSKQNIIHWAFAEIQTMHTLEGKLWILNSQSQPLKNGMFKVKLR